MVQLVKYLAVLLFSIELLAPAVLQMGSVANSQPSHDTTLTVQGIFNNNLLSAMLYEEAGSEEEESKATRAALDLPFSGSTGLADAPIAAQLHLVASYVNSVAPSKRPLFALHHSFLI